MKHILLISLLFSSHLILFGQSSVKLQPVHIIGTVYSVDYDQNNQPSTTVNTRANVFDGNFDTFFASYDRSNTWVGLDLGEKHVITKVAYCPRAGLSQRLQLGIFEGANLPDFGDAVPLCMIPDAPAERRLTEQAVTNSRGFRYVRYVGPHDVRCNIAELEFYGYPSAGDDSNLAQLTNIPDVIIHTVDTQDITSKTTYVKGIASFISKDGAEIYTDSIEIRGRGNASWDFEKKPYRIKLSKKARILGNPAEARNWTLISNHSDKTLMRNLLAFDISKRLQMPYTPAGQPVNVYLNGEYKGCYQFCDHIDVRKNRVDVTEMKKTDLAGENLTGGYLIEIDAYAYTEAKWFNSNRNTPVTIKSPDSDDIVTQQFDYIKNHFNKWEASVLANNYTDPENGFRKYMDTKTFVRHFLVGELSGNIDTYWSVYMYKQRGDDKFYFGPVWDYDLAFENDQRVYPISGWNGNSDWLFRRGSSAGDISNEINRLLTDPELFNEIKQTYANYRDWGYLTEEKLLQVIDDYAVEMNASQQLNFIRWDVLNRQIHQNNRPAGSYQGEVDVVKKYISDRIAWMDTKLAYIPNPDNKEPDDAASIETICMKPFKLWTENKRIHIEEITERLQVEIITMTGQLINRQKVNGSVSFSVPQGAYIVRVYDDHGNRQIVKCFVP